MIKYYIILFPLFSIQPLKAQISFADSCFASSAVGTNFVNSVDLSNNVNGADLMSWNSASSTWEGSWALADLTMPPPDSLSGCRAMFIGNGITWTTGGEGFGMRLNNPVVSGQNYSFTVTYVSDGFGSDGAFSPRVYVSNSSAVPSGTYLGNLPAAGYSWLTSTFSFTATPAENGYQWIILFTDSFGTSGIVNSFCPGCQTVNCALQVNLGPDTAICAGQQITLNAGAVNGATYLWQDNSAGSTYTVSNAGTYWVRVKSGQCTSSDTIVISSDPLPHVFLGSDTTICTGQLVLNAGNAGASYIWSNSATTQALAIDTAGLYAVTVTSAAGCISTDSIHVAYMPAVTINSNKLIMCPGDSAYICAVPGYLAYNWNTGDTSACINAAAAGDYYVTVSESSNCQVQSNHISIGVYQPPPVITNVSGDTLEGFNSGNYQWLLNGSAIAGATDSVFIAKTEGTYNLQVADSNGCISTSNPIEITGISNELSENSIAVFPNPTNGGWKLNVSNAWVGSMIEIFDATGRSVFKSQIENNYSLIEITGMAGGVYELRLGAVSRNACFKLIKL